MNLSINGNSATNSENILPDTLYPSKDQMEDNRRNTDHCRLCLQKS